MLRPAGHIIVVTTAPRTEHPATEPGSLRRSGQISDNFLTSIVKKGASAWGRGLLLRGAVFGKYLTVHMA